MRRNTGKVEMHVLAAAVKLLAGIFVCAALVGSTALAQNSPPVITFDAPGAGTGSYQGTIATAISAAGVIAGYYLDSNWGCHGFVRNSDGTYISFDTPSRQLGAPTCPQPASFNAAGVIIGVESDPSFGCTAWSQSDQNPEGCGGNHGFIRMPDGRITIFDGPVNPSFANPSTVPK